MDATQNTALEAIHEEVRRCQRCPLHVGRTHAVPGAGPCDADIMFIGEAPGFHEDQQGLPFVGAAGNFLDQLLKGIGIDRSKVTSPTSSSAVRRETAIRKGTKWEPVGIT
jgi:DNA polymerase